MTWQKCNMPALKLILKSSHKTQQTTHCIFWNFKNKTASLESFRTPVQAEDQAKWATKAHKLNSFVAFKSLPLLFGLPGKPFRRYNSFLLWVLVLSTVSPHSCIPNYFCLSLSLRHPKPSRTLSANYSLHLFPQRGLNVLPVSNAVIFAWFCRQVIAISLNKPLFLLSFQLGFK